MEIYFICSFVTCIEWILALLLPKLVSMPQLLASLYWVSLQATQGFVFIIFYNHFYLCWSQILYRQWKYILYAYLWHVFEWIWALLPKLVSMPHFGLTLLSLSTSYTGSHLTSFRWMATDKPRVVVWVDPWWPPWCTVVAHYHEYKLK
jgi:hypothetical protein